MFQCETGFYEIVEIQANFCSKNACLKGSVYLLITDRLPQAVSVVEVEYKLHFVVLSIFGGAMQTVRRYVFLTAIGLVAALVFLPSASFLPGNLSSYVGEGEGQISKSVLLHLFAALVIFTLVKQAASGIPNIFRARLQRLRRNITLLLVISLLGSVFLIA